MSLSALSQFKLSSMSGDNARAVRVSAQDRSTGQDIQLEYLKQKTVGSGTFGVVYKAKLIPSNEVVAIKEVLQDNRYKNRELQILRSLDHPNICVLRAHFYRYEDDAKKFSKRSKKDKTYLNLVMDYMPETMYSVCQRYSKSKQRMPMLAIKLYMYQLFRSLAYCHHLGICHRDIKLYNILVDPNTGVLKLCDFGSAKPLVEGESNVAYICSRYYRAPELIFGATMYTTTIDIWSAGCVMGELLSGRPLFPGKSSIDQLVEIIKVLGTPTKLQIERMNPSYIAQKLPKVDPKPLSKLFRSSTPQDALDLLTQLLQYDPDKRLTAIEAMTHPFFNELRSSPGAVSSSSSSSSSSSTSTSPSIPTPTTSKLSTKAITDVNGLPVSTPTDTTQHPWPPLFNFTKEELMIRPDLKSKLVPHDNYFTLDS
ncbi:Pkinase-domain-containing protein [Absidia repens]|uniref:Pkinase-domain-containing protein n=1 Tax=Absidia repens TaxID=90262 RepID=A0A1X2IPD6_9FUNG|nr:Pkinase-domain-containing protein [Absidia repens]